MKRSRFSEAQIIGILKEHQAGMGAPELCRKCPSPLNLCQYIGRERGIGHGEETTFRRRRAEAAA